MIQPALTSIPIDTDNAARYVYPPNHPYLRLGRGVEEILRGIEWGDLTISLAVGVEPWRLALITVFQYKEQLSDMQAVEAVRVRTDWKYALHLPMVILSVRPAGLCCFRKTLLDDQPRRVVLQQVINRLEKFGFLSWPGANPLGAAALLTMVCTTERLYCLSATMAAALEAAAAKDHEWLRAVMLPHWYSRYGRRVFEGCENEAGQRACVEEIGGDARYLLDQVHETGPAALKELPGIKNLEIAWRENYEQASEPGAWSWRPVFCAGCPLKGCRYPREPI